MTKSGHQLTTGKLKSLTDIALSMKKLMRCVGNGRTITPIRVTHELLLQVYYSIYGESVKGEKIKGPGELRLMSVRVPIHLPSVSHSLHYLVWMEKYCCKLIKISCSAIVCLMPFLYQLMKNVAVQLTISTPSFPPRQM